MQIKSQATRNLDDCRNKLFKYMRENNIKPYGTIVEFRKGFKMWGEKIENGKTSSNLYYVDYECIAKWCGNRTGWKYLQKSKETMVFGVEKEKERKNRPALYRVKMTFENESCIYDSALDCAEQLGIDRTYVYKSMSNGNRHKGMKFEKLPLQINS